MLVVTSQMHGLRAVLSSQTVHVETQVEEHQSQAITGTSSAMQSAVCMLSFDIKDHHSVNAFSK